MTSSRSTRRSSSTRGRGRRAATSPASPIRSSTAGRASCGSAPTSSTTAQCGRKPSKQPGETPECDLTEARDFNLMFETTVGPVKEEGSTVYLRPETAQGIFLNFKNYLQFSRKKPPFGIAQIGKSFRNEITTGNFIFRTREFEQMEMEFFVPPDEAGQWFEHWLEQRTELVHAARDPARPPAPARPRRRRAVALLERHQRHRVPVPDRLVRARGDRQPRRLRPAPARRVLRPEARVRRHRLRRPLRPPRDRAGGRRRSRDARVPGRRLRRGRDRGRDAHRAAAPPAARAGQGRGAAAGAQGRPAGARRARSTASCATASRPSTTRAARSGGATAARTRSARRGRSRSTTSRSRTAPSRCATATASPRTGSRSTSSARRSSGGSGPVALAKAQYVAWELTRP